MVVIERLDWFDLTLELLVTDCEVSEAASLPALSWMALVSSLADGSV